MKIFFMILSLAGLFASTANAKIREGDMMECRAYQAVGPDRGQEFVEHKTSCAFKYKCLQESPHGCGSERYSTLCGTPGESLYYVSADTSSSETNQYSDFHIRLRISTGIHSSDELLTTESELKEGEHFHMRPWQTVSAIDVTCRLINKRK